MKEEVKQLLMSTNREGMQNLIEALDKYLFFDLPASIKFHSNYDSGLIEHSMKVYKLFKEMIDKFSINNEKEVISQDSIIICSLLHDVCKANSYKKVGNCWIWNSSNPDGHSKLSLHRIKQFIILTQQEEEIIKYHMGFYGTTEFSSKGEYTLQELVNAYNNNNLAKLFYFCDDMSSQFLENTR